MVDLCRPGHICGIDTHVYKNKILSVYIVSLFFITLTVYIFMSTFTDNYILCTCFLALVTMSWFPCAVVPQGCEKDFVVIDSHRFSWDYTERHRIIHKHTARSVIFARFKFSLILWVLIHENYWILTIQQVIRIGILQKYEPRNHFSFQNHKILNPQKQPTIQ